MPPSLLVNASGSESIGASLGATLKPQKSPRPHHLSLNSPATTSTASGSSGSDMPPTETPVPPTPTHGLRAQLHHLLPRHALFHVRLQIHQISSVPLVHGEFGVRWKFKNVHTVPGTRAGLLGIVRSKSRARCNTLKGKGVMRDGDGDGDGDGDEDVDASDGSPGSGYTSPDASITTSGDDQPSIPSVIVSGHHNSSSSSSASTPNSHNNTQMTPEWLPSSFLSPTSSAYRVAIPFASTTSNSQSNPSLSSTTPLEGYAHSRGITPFIKLKDHNVTWEHTLDVVIKMDVDRDTTNLLPNELKLVVMQRVIPGDPDAPHNPRLGALYLNLAEYASVDSVTRRYLLCESKTNATLKLTIQLEHVGGETQYNAPPLPKGEILNGIAGLLESDVYRTRPKALELFGPFYGGEVDLVGLGLGAGKGKSVGGSRMGGDGENVPFDVDKLAMAYGPKTTENLIEAIFNPVATTEKKESPFTYYVPPQRDLPALSNGKGKDKAVEGYDATLSVGGRHMQAEVASIYSTGSSSEGTYTSVHTTSTSTSGGSWGSRASSYHIGDGDVGPGGRVKGWFKKIGMSRPGTPTPTAVR